MDKQKARILIVDDEFSVRDSLYNWLRKDGFDAIAAEGGAEALQVLQEKQNSVSLK